uniref:Uncharacterized protein n=1 Tax=Lepeophtheirus salmonis TaxID=72036 RepID=A0A0K2T2W9_LEPSM
MTSLRLLASILTQSVISKTPETPVWVLRSHQEVLSRTRREVMTSLAS